MAVNLVYTVPNLSGYLTIAAAAAAYQPLDPDLLSVTWTVEDPAPVDETRYFSLYAPFAGTVDALTHKLASGSCTIAIQINGTPVTGLSAVSVTNSKASTNASGANTIAIGDELTYVVSASAAPVGLSLAIRATR